MYYYAKFISSSTIEVCIKADSELELQTLSCKVADQFFLGDHFINKFIDNGFIINPSIVCIYKKLDAVIFKEANNTFLS